MLVSNIIGEMILYLVALPLMAFQSIEMMQALIEFAADVTQYYQSKS